MKKLLLGTALAFLSGGWILAQSGAFISPKGNEAWMLGSLQAILWSHSGKAQVRLVLFAPSGAKAGVVKTNLKLADGYFHWIAGRLDNTQGVPPGKGYTLQLKIDGTSVILDTSAPFEIVPAPPSGKPPVTMIPVDPGPRTNPGPVSPILRVSQPAAGTVVEPGGECPIRWTLVAGGYAAVKIMFYPSGQPRLARSGQVSWISQNTANDGAFSWKLAATERTGKYVVRVQTLDDKVFGDSGEITIGTPALPIVKNIAPAIKVQLPQSASLSIQQVDFDMEEPGVVTGISVKAAVNSSSDFVLDNTLGHKQYGPLYARCVVEVPVTQDEYSKSPGLFAPKKIGDDVYALKGTGYFWLNASPTRFTSGGSTFTANFAPHLQGQALGQEVVRQMPRAQICRKQYFPKLTVTLHLVTQGGEAIASKTVYLIYNAKKWPLKTIVLSTVVNMCLQGIQQW